MKKISFYPIASLIILIVSCSKMDDLHLDFSNLGTGYWGPQFLYINRFEPAALSYFNLPAGKYYIYKDPATGMLDSVGVTKSLVDLVYKTSTGGNAPGTPYYYSTYDLILTNFTATGNQPWFKAHASCDSDFKNMPAFIDSNFVLTEVQTTIPVFWYPLGTYGTMQFNKIASTTIEGVTYYDVYSFSATNGLQPTHTNYKATTFWWAKDTGIIKREDKTINSVKTWLLLRHGQQ